MTLAPRLVYCNACGARYWLREPAVAESHATGVVYVRGDVACDQCGEHVLRVVDRLRVDLNRSYSGECNSADCRHSLSRKCRCSCGGVHHGVDVLAINAEATQ